uniref:Secreted protein n=1 Tax=Steinernema glaseri TaxID=37863 RepID=A0A1I7ZVU7_9BILA
MHFPSRRAVESVRFFAAAIFGLQFRASTDCISSLRTAASASAELVCSGICRLSPSRSRRKPLTAIAWKHDFNAIMPPGTQLTMRFNHTAATDCTVLTRSHLVHTRFEQRIDRI